MDHHNCKPYELSLHLEVNSSKFTLRNIFHNIKGHRVVLKKPFTFVLLTKRDNHCLQSAETYFGNEERKITYCQTPDNSP